MATTVERGSVLLIECLKEVESDADLERLERWQTQVVQHEVGAVLNVLDRATPALGEVTTLEAHAGEVVPQQVLRKLADRDVHLPISKNLH